jgi:hypothetical protein
MSLIKQFDQVPYYYTFEYYLHEQELDYTVLDYAQNNGIELGSLICFFDIIKNDVYYIVTTNENNSHKVISISKSSSVNNLIMDNIIYYNGYKFTTSDNMSLLSVENLIGISCNDIIICEHAYMHKKFIDNKIKWWLEQGLKCKRICSINNLRILSIITNCEHAIVHNIISSQTVKSSIAKLNMTKLFPNLKKIYDFDCETIYQRETK